MGIFSEGPISFKMDRKSPLTSKLKASISKRLVQFLGNYTDDVLAEYIIVLVCNGKDQIQARDDLEAFLGEKSGEFVSWLWNHLLKSMPQSNSDINLLDANDVPVISSRCGSADRDLKSNRIKEVRSPINGNADSTLTKNGKHSHPSSHASKSLPSHSMEVSEDLKYCKGPPTVPLNIINSKVVHPQKQRSIITRSVGSTEDSHDDSLARESYRMGKSSLITTGRGQSFECVDKSKNIICHEGNGLPSQLLNLSRGEMIFRNKQHHIEEEPHTTNIHGTSASTRHSPRAVGETSCQTKNSRGSVWDRLGKPCEENSSLDGKNVEAHVDYLEKDRHMREEHASFVSYHNEKRKGSMSDEVLMPNKSCGLSNIGECRKLELKASTLCKSSGATDIQRKRHFSEISPGSSCRSVSMFGRINSEQQNNENSKDFKRLNSTSEAGGPALNSEVQHVKQKLLQVEMEVSKLKTKQLEIKKDGQQRPLSSSGVIKHLEGDVDSRTVFVSNVHFAATKEALSLHFAKCGVVLNVVMLTEKLTAQPKGSAYITFADKKSVDRALALSGTSFFSRTLKVLRKAEEGTTISTPPESAGKLFQVQVSQNKRKSIYDRPFYPSSHFQWRREPGACPSESSASMSETKVVSSVPSK
ncbi:hypothetical protein NMG60_11025909 [Bertholletia excelsa]